MTTRETVKAYQQKLAEHVRDFGRASARLEQAVQRRTEALAVQDQMVNGAQGVVDRTIVDMAADLGPELAAGLTGLEPSEVKRLVKSAATPAKVAEAAPVTSPKATGP